MPQRDPTTGQYTRTDANDALRTAVTRRTTPRVIPAGVPQGATAGDLLRRALGLIESQPAPATDSPTASDLLRAALTITDKES